MSQTDPDHLLALERSLLDPHLRRSPEHIAAHLHPDFVEIASSGQLYTRDQVIESLQLETDIVRTCEDFRVRLLSPTVAMVTYRMTRAQGGSAPTYSRRLSIWTLRGDTWSIIYHHGTPVKAANG